MLGSLWVPRGKKTPFNNRLIRMERTSWFERLHRELCRIQKIWPGSEVRGPVIDYGKERRAHEFYCAI